jgi:hypothetical protein
MKQKASILIFVQPIGESFAAYFPFMGTKLQHCPFTRAIIIQTERFLPKPERYYFTALYTT